MRQSFLPPLCPMVLPRSTGLCRLLSVPAGRRTFPRHLCESFPACLDPYPGCPCGAFTRFFPQDFGLPYVVTRSALSNAPYSDFSTGSFFEAAVIPLCSGPQVCSPPRSPLPKVYFMSVGSSACSFSPRFRASASLSRNHGPLVGLGSRGFSFRAPHSLLPPCVPDMLAV